MALTEGRAGTDALGLVGRIVIVLGVDALVNRLFEHAKEIVTLEKDAVKIVLVNVVIEGIVGVDEGD